MEQSKINSVDNDHSRGQIKKYYYEVDHYHVIQSFAIGSTLFQKGEMISIERSDRSVKMVFKNSDFYQSLRAEEIQENLMRFLQKMS